MNLVCEIALKKLEQFSIITIPSIFKMLVIDIKPVNNDLINVYINKINNNKCNVNGNMQIINALTNDKNDPKKFVFDENEQTLQRLQMTNIDSVEVHTVILLTTVVSTE